MDLVQNYWTAVVGCVILCPDVRKKSGSEESQAHYVSTPNTPFTEGSTSLERICIMDVQIW